MKRLLTPRSGQAMVMSALMMTVFFGMLALVVDLGFIMVQRRQQQNAADAASMGVAKAMAASIAVDTNGNNVFIDQTDTAVLDRAWYLASANHIGPGVTRTAGIEYLDCAGVLIRAAVNGSAALAPSNTCMVRATGTSSMNGFFIQAADPSITTTGTSARATARIAPTVAATQDIGVWPITRWMDHPNAGNNCLTVVAPPAIPAPCVFWSNNGGSEDTSIGSFKEKIYLSRYSQCEYKQPTTPQIITQWDTTRPGVTSCPTSASAYQSDMEHWFRYGFKGIVTPGNKIEVTDPGSQANNYADEMMAYINAAPEYPPHPTWGNHRTVQVMMWKIGEKWSKGANEFVCWNAPGCGGGAPDRITVYALYCFKFYEYWVQSSEVRGFKVGCLQDTPPSGGPPGGGANTVVMVD